MDDGIPRLEVDHLINPRWIGVLLGVVVASVIFQQVVLFFAGAILTLALALSWVWGRFCLDDLTYRRTFGRPTVAFGDDVTLTIEIVNRKPLPLPWIDISDEIPAAVELVRGEVLYSWRPGRRILPHLLALRWYERVVRRYQLHCPARGEHVFWPVEVRSGDLFGLATRRIEWPARQTLLVYPKVVPVAALGLSARFPLGDARGPNRLVRDPLRLAGIRPYTDGDSIRQMHWKATARLGALQVKTYDPSTTLRAMLFLNLDTMPRAWEGIRPDLLELAICTTASLASHLVGERYQVGLAANGLLARTTARVRVPPSRAPGHLATILSMLARLTAMATLPFTDLLRVERRHVPAGATIVVITGLLDDAIRAQAHAYRAAGHPVLVLVIGDDLRGAREPGLDVRWIGDEARWRALLALRVTGQQVRR